MYEHLAAGGEDLLAVGREDDVDVRAVREDLSIVILSVPGELGCVS